MKLFKVLCVLALVFAVSAVAHAETQSVKISGDLTVQGIARDDYDLRSTDIEANGESSDWATYGQAITEVQIDADLTDNVSGVVRIVNQRVLGNDNYESVNGGELRYISEQGTVGNRQIVGSGAAFELSLDLAYIELKEFLYSPLTLKIGRQDIWFGKGFIIGANQLDPAAGTGTLYAAEYTAINSFDAVRGTLDYDPWTIDLVASKIVENARRSDDDIGLYGVNIGYMFDDYNAEMEGYWFFKQARNVGAPIGATTTPPLTSANGHNTNDVHTFGIRGSFDPIEDWTIFGEGAYQIGEYMIAGQARERERRAYAIDIGAECRYFQDNYAWKPVVGAEYILYSGENLLGAQGANTTGNYNGWDPMFRGKFDTAIREFQNVYYATAQATTPSYTNQHQVIVRGSVEPTDSLTLEGLYAHFWLDEDFTAALTDKDIGSEVDLNLTWDYTEDVQFGLLTAWFIPGDHWRSPNDDIATDVVGSVKLSF